MDHKALLFLLRDKSDGSNGLMLAESGDLRCMTVYEASDIDRRFASMMKAIRQTVILMSSFATRGCCERHQASVRGFLSSVEC